MARIRRQPLDERGTGLLGSVIGVSVVMAILGLAVNVTLGLWTRATVDSVVYDAARRVATAPAGTDSAVVEHDALRRARDLLGRYGRDVELRFEHAPDDEVVVLRVRAPGVSLLPRMLGSAPVVGGVDRRIVVRREQP